MTEGTREQFYKWLSELHKKIEGIKTGNEYGNLILYRGQDCNSTPLPLLFRKEHIKHKDRERDAYFFFHQNAGNKIKGINDWGILSMMRHNGVPTRLLDWTDSLEVALYFAIENLTPEKDAYIWYMNSFELYKAQGNEGNNHHPDTIKFSYLEFIENPKIRLNEDNIPLNNILVIKPLNINERIIRQRSFFTFHFREEEMNTIFPGLVKIEKLPAELIQEAKKYLSINGVNKYFLFDDLGILGSSIRETYFK